MKLFDQIKNFMNSVKILPHQCGGCVPMDDFMYFEKITPEEPVFFHHVQDDNTDIFLIAVKRRDLRKIEMEMQKCKIES